MTEPHWPADGSGDEFDGGRDDSAPGEAPQFPVPELRGRYDVTADVLKNHLAAALPSDPNYHPGDYESPHTAPFVQVRVNGELVPGHIVYPWPDGGLVVEPLEVAP